jgi:hypothetical protein
VTGATTITMKCAADAAGSACGATIGEQAHMDNQKKQLVTVAKHPYICLACWRAGWRSDAPMTTGAPWRIYKLDGHPQVLKS